MVNRSVRACRAALRDGRFRRALLLSATVAAAAVLPFACRSPTEISEPKPPEPISEVFSPPRPGAVLENPYAEVEWRSAQRHKANLHTHTRNSDGRHRVRRVVDEYHSAGYTILSITDHNSVTWPWSEYDRDPDELGMVAIRGNEISDTHHLGSYFSDFNINGRTYRPFIGRMGLPPTAVTEEEVLDGIAAADGLSVLFHPGRYDHAAEWYEELYRGHDHLVGLEVVNQNDRYPQDRALWDEILTELMPERPVWGFANDDFHRMAHFGHAYNVFLLKEASERTVRRAMEGGSFTFRNGSGAPPIAEIAHDREAGTVTVRGSGRHTVRWVSDGRYIAEGAVISYRRTPNLGSYLRAELYGPGGVSYTNPFGVRSGS